VAREGSGFESDDNEVVLVLKGGENVAISRAPKTVIAHRIFDEVVKLRMPLHA
jgi:phosphopantothenoylcysteine synthetase/decarboxylase